MWIVIVPYWSLAEVAFYFYIGRILSIIRYNLHIKFKFIMRAEY